MENNQAGINAGYLISGLVILILALVLFPHLGSPTQIQWSVQVIIIALGGALASMGLQGWIGIQSDRVKAGGSLAIFVLLLYFVPKLPPNAQSPTLNPSVPLGADQNNPGTPPGVQPGSPDEKRSSVPPQPQKPETACELYNDAKSLAPKPGQQWKPSQRKQAEEKLRRSIKLWTVMSRCEEQYVYKDLGFLLLTKDDAKGEARNLFLTALSKPNLHPGNNFAEYKDFYIGLADTLPDDGRARARSVAEDPNNGCSHYNLAHYLDHPNQPAGSLEFKARFMELQRAEATFSESCGNRAFVKKDLGCAYAAVGDSRAAAELTTHPSGDLTGVNFCRSLISLPPLTQ